MRVLLVGINYFPEQTGIGPYTTGAAEYLATRGHSVRVHTGLPSYPQWQVEASYGGFIWRTEQLNGVEILRNWHYVPRRPSAPGRALYEVTFGATAARAILAWRPDAVIGVVPSLMGGLLSRLVARRFNCPYGILFQDFMTAATTQSGMQTGAVYEKVAGEIEKWIARGAAAVGTISDSGFEVLTRMGVARDRIQRLRNWTRPEAKAATGDHRPHFGIPANAFVILHAGNIGYKQGLETVLDCAERTRDRPNWIYWFVGDGNRRFDLETAARDRKLTNVRFSGVLSSADFAKALPCADVLLLSQRKSVSNMSFPSKLTTYLVAGKPLLASVAEGTEAAAEVTLSGAGIVIPPENAFEMSSSLDLLERSPELRLSMAGAGLAFADRVYSERSCLAGFEAFLAAIVSRDHDRL